MASHHQLSIDEANESIYHSLKISYGVKDDPDNQAITIRAFAVAHRRSVEPELGLPVTVQGDEGLCGGLKFDRFEVWLDKSPVAERIVSVAKALGR